MNLREWDTRAELRCYVAATRSVSQAALPTRREVATLQASWQRCPAVASKASGATDGSKLAAQGEQTIKRTQLGLAR
jgi:hypothetical protein